MTLNYISLRYGALSLAILYGLLSHTAGAKNNKEHSSQQTKSEGPFYRDNKAWEGGKQKHWGHSKKMTLAQLRAARKKCDKDPRCFSGYKAFMKDRKGFHGWHCGARPSGPDGLYLSPIDYACWLHDRKKYTTCGLHHALYCRYVHKGHAAIFKDLNKIQSSFVRYQGKKCYKKYIVVDIKHELPDCNKPRN